MAIVKNPVYHALTPRLKRYKHQISWVLGKYGLMQEYLSSDISMFRTSTEDPHYWAFIDISFQKDEVNKSPRVKITVKDDIVTSHELFFYIEDKGWKKVDEWPLSSYP